MGLKFNKPAKTIAEQIDLLKRRGLVVTNSEFAQHCLQHISYYRLRAYWFPFEARGKEGTHQIAPGTTFELVLALYDFDRKLRLLILDAVERIEVAARGSWAYRLATEHGPHGYLQARLYRTRKLYAQNRGHLETEIRRSQDTFINHYKDKYGDPELPPVWMVAEVISLGQLSKWQTALRERADVKAISEPFGLDHRVYLAFIHHLAMIRNICAHHGRLWNRQFTVTMKLPSYPERLAASISHSTERRIYNTLATISAVMRIVAPQSDWRHRLVELLKEHPTRDLGTMGFPNGWETLPEWVEH